MNEVKTVHLISIFYMHLIHHIFYFQQQVFLHSQKIYGFFMHHLIL
jgi:hypothetical protein